MILRVCVCIPTYNNPTTIPQVVRDTLSQTDFPILVVDDGSTEPIANLVEKSPRVTIIRHESNQGKGVALQSAIKWAVEQNFTHLVTIDGDGQHYPSEISKLVELARKNPWSLVIGNRKLQSETVPGISKFGRNFSNFWVNFQTGNKVADSQSGFRMYPLFFLQNMSFFTKRYDFEIEVLIRLMWKNVPVQEIEIEVFYPDKETRVSHFNKFWDNVRISCLNTVLVASSLLTSRTSPGSLAVSVGVGVLIGCSPFFGLHIFIVALFTFAFRLNGIAALIGSHISIPPLAPFLILASIKIGKNFNSGNNFLAWLEGSLILGAGLGIIFGLITYITARMIQSKKTQKVNWSGRARGGVIGNGFLKLVLKYTHIKAGYFCLYFIIPYFYLFAPKARRGLNEYWKILEPTASWIQLQKQVISHLFKFGQVLMDRVYQSFNSEVKFTPNPNGLENILAPLRSEQGLILLGAHCGGWDLSAAILGRLKNLAELHVVNFQSKDFSFDNIKAIDDKGKVNTVDTNQSQQPVFEIHQILKAKKAIGLMGDRPMSDRYELVKFFGKLAPIDTTPFRLASATQTPLLTTFAFKAHAMTYDFYANPSRVYQYTNGRARELDCYDWAQEFANQLEAKLFNYRDQWFNFYSYWSSVPVAQTASAVPNHLLEELNKRTLHSPQSVSGAKTIDT